MDKENTPAALLLGAIVTYLVTVDPAGADAMIAGLTAIIAILTLLNSQ